MYEFTEFEIERKRQQWKREGLKPRTINRDIDRLHAVLAKAAKWGVLDGHPFKELKQLKTDQTGLVRYLNPDEETALRAALVGRERKLCEARIRFNTWRIARGKRPLPERTGDYLDHLRPLVLVAINTGLRRAELLGLTWSAVDLHHKLLTVIATNAKSGNTRHVPLNAEALDVLTAWKARQQKPAADALVFPGSDGRRMKRIDTAWDSLMKTAGIKKFRFHDCRHHFASRLVQAGVPLNTVRELLGHRDIETTMIYAHLAPQNLRAAVDTIKRATA
jgi:integrase